jgi:hypothetical protein
MGRIALFCLALVPAALLILLACSAVKAFKAGDKMTALFDTIAFFVLFSLIAAAVLIFCFGFA